LHVVHFHNELIGAKTRDSVQPYDVVREDNHTHCKVSYDDI